MYPSNIFCWNVRGLNSRARQETVCTLVTSCQADIIYLQETKIAAISRGVLLSMLGSEFTNWVEVPAIGASGGIIIAWQHGLGQALASRIDQYSVSMKFSTTACNHGG
jgi:hypothetical protein